MSTRVITAKNATIKFSVSPRFKKLAQEKAKEVGFSLSDLGRFLFGVYIHGETLTPPLVSPQLFQKAQLSQIRKELEGSGELGASAIEGVIEGLRESHAYKNNSSSSQ